MDSTRFSRRRAGAAARLAVALTGILVGMLCAAATAKPGADGAAAATDPFLWLETVDGKRAMAWVRKENAKTLRVLEKDPRYGALYSQALAIAEARDRLPKPEFLGGDVYNFWQDADHVRGIWRTTTLAQYRTPQTEWTTVLDLDRLARAEKSNWYWSGIDCERPAERRCLVSLSDGGEDAVTVREFDLGTRQFVKNGFRLPKGKQGAAWLDTDTLLVCRDWGAGTMTTSGYPFVAKMVERGRPLSEAKLVFQGEPSDVGTEVATLQDGSGHRASLIVRHVTFFESEVYLLRPAGPVRLDLPPKAEVSALVDGQLVVTLNQDWLAHGTAFAPGSLASINLASAYSDPQHVQPVLIYAPGPRESLGEVATTRSHLIVTTYENVRGRAAVYSRAAEGTWSRRALPLPDLASIDVASADARSDDAFLTVTGFLAPPTLWLADAATDEVQVAKELAAKFDATGHVVEQYEATSPDGTAVPYFVVRPRDMKLDGQNPTILTAYGGFQISKTPYYPAILGKLWLERGGVLVVANIRGGGEFGPAWHEAGLKTHRQRIYDDFTAVAEDLIARKVTSARRLGIEGGSNGGLLMGVAFTQRPTLWNAVDMQVPLLDMLRFEQIAAGPSWIGEYGSVAIPQERAFLASISPYHNLRPGVRYPLPLIWTTTKDDRVGPQHARKFAARLAEMGIPYLFYEVIEGGHAAGANLKETTRTRALEMTYYLRQLVD
jgi:prolyl oligopeptidase